ncbi:MAG TPA: glycerol-3-phosphate 1-O-acyltransferase PlsY [Caulobacteraceae bacterium]
MVLALSPTVGAVASLAGGYLLGSIPFGVIASRLGGAGDIRSIGSGNIGATNVLRTGRRDLAAITLLGDAGKGAVAVLLAWRFLGPTAAVLAGGAAFMGHLFSVWLKFQGGKAVATFFGVMLAMAWPAGLAAGAVWVVMAAAFRLSSLASLTAAALAPVLVFTLDPGAEGHSERILLAVFMAVLIFLRHRQNIGRLLRSEEPRLGARKTRESTVP